MFNSQKKDEDYQFYDKDSERWYCDSFCSEMEESTCEKKQEKKIIKKSVGRIHSDIDIIVVINEMRKQVIEMDVKIKKHKEMLKEVGNDSELIQKIKERINKKEYNQESSRKCARWFCFF